MFPGPQHRNKGTTETERRYQKRNDGTKNRNEGTKKRNDGSKNLGLGAPAEARGEKKIPFFGQFVLQWLTLLGKPVLDRRLRPTAKDVQNNAESLALT